MVQSNISKEVLSLCHQHYSKDILEVFDAGPTQPSLVHDKTHTQRFCILISACSESDHEVPRGSFFPLAWHLSKDFCFPWWISVRNTRSQLKYKMLQSALWAAPTSLLIKHEDLMPQPINKKSYLYGICTVPLVAATLNCAGKLTLSSSGIACSIIVTPTAFCEQPLQIHSVLESTRKWF